MGLFTSSKITSTTSDHRHTQQSQITYHGHRDRRLAGRKYSFTDPPNVYLSPPPPPPPPAPISRPAPPYRHHNHSQPAFRPAGYLPAPPATTTVDWTAPPALLMNAGVNTMQQMASSCRWTGAVGEIAKAVPAYDDISKRFNEVMTLIDCESLKGHEMDLFSCTAKPTDQRRGRPRDKLPQTHGEARRTRSADEDGERALFKPCQKKKESEVKKHHSGEKKSSGKPSKEKLADREKDKIQPANVAASVVAGTYFSKVQHYANSRLPSDLPPLSL